MKQNNFRTNCEYVENQCNKLSGSDQTQSYIPYFIPVRAPPSVGLNTKVPFQLHLLNLVLQPDTNSSPIQSAFLLNQAPFQKTNSVSVPNVAATSSISICSFSHRHLSVSDSIIFQFQGYNGCGVFLQAKLLLSICYKAICYKAYTNGLTVSWLINEKILPEHLLKVQVKSDAWELFYSTEKC